MTRGRTPVRRPAPINGKKPISKINNPKNRVVPTTRPRVGGYGSTNPANRTPQLQRLYAANKSGKISAKAFDSGLQDAAAGRPIRIKIVRPYPRPRYVPAPKYKLPIQNRKIAQKKFNNLTWRINGRMMTKNQFLNSTLHQRGVNTYAEYVNLFRVKFG